MEILLWPTDILRHVSYWLGTDDLQKLKECGSVLLSRRLSQELIVLDLRLARSAQAVEMVSAFSHLRSLVIFDSNINWKPWHRIGWVEALPKSLEVVNFQFPSALAVWLRRAVPGEFHWSVVSNQYGYVPIFLCDHLPKLKQLTLHGNWNSVISHEEVSPYLLLDELVRFRKKANTYKMTSPWTAQMKALFLKKLPPDLELLCLPFHNFADLAAPHLPTHLSHLLDVPESEGSSLVIRFLQTLKESLLTSLVAFSWILPIGVFPTLIASFSSLESLEITLEALPSAHYPLLPRQLTHLALKCSNRRGSYPYAETEQFDYMDFAHLPRSLTSLVLKRCAAPQNYKESAAGYTSSLSTPLSDLLPSSLTSLTLKEMLSTWDVPEALKSLIKIPLSFLHLSVHANGNMDNALRFESIAWLPIKTLETLEIITEKTAIRMDSAIDEALFSNWNVESTATNRIKKLKLGGFISTAASTHLVQRLPPGLTALQLTHLDTHKFPLEDFFRVCPVSLTSVDLALYKEHTSQWTDSMIAKNIPKTLRHLQCPIQSDCTLIPEHITEASYSSLRDVYATHYPALVRCKLIEHGVPTLHLHQHLVSVDLIVKAGISHPLWQLPKLEKASISALLWTDETFCPITSSLRSLRINSESTSAKWLGHELFQRLTALDCSLAPSPVEDIRRLKELTSLTDLRCQVADYGDSDSDSDSDSDDTQDKADKRKRGSFREQKQAFLSSLPVSLRSFRSSHSIDVVNSFWSEPVVLQLHSLVLSGATMQQTQLAALAPNLKELGVQSVIITDRQDAFKGFSPTMEESSELLFARSICPSIESLVKAVSSSNVAVKWVFAEDDAFHSVTPENYPASQADISRAQIALRALPRDLKLSKTKLLVPQLGPCLPKTLISLQLDTPLPLQSHSINDFLGDLPSTLLVLGFTMPTACSTLSLLPLPAGLKSLSITHLTGMQESAVKMIPPSLTEFIAPEWEAGPEVQYLPTSIRNISLSTIDPLLAIDQLPPKLMVFRYSMKSTTPQQTTEILRRLEKFNLLHFYCNRGIEEDPTSSFSVYLNDILEKL